jgi:hypothetical protein
MRIAIGDESLGDFCGGAIRMDLGLIGGVALDFARDSGFAQDSGFARDSDFARDLDGGDVRAP